MPSFNTVGAGNSSNGGITVTAPAGRSVGDMLILAVETSNEVVTTPSGWTAVPGTVVGSGTSAVGSGARITVFYRVADGTASDNATLAAVTNHIQGAIAAYSGSDGTVGTGQWAAGDNTSNPTFPAITTTVTASLVVLCCAREQSTVDTSGYSNANLSSITERYDASVAGPLDPARLVIVDGRAGAPGNIGTTTTSGANNRWSAVTFELPAYKITADAGAFAFTGISAGVTVALKIAAAAAAFSFTGVSAALTMAFKIAAGVGAFALNGLSVAFDLFRNAIARSTVRTEKRSTSIASETRTTNIAEESRTSTAVGNGRAPRLSHAREEDRTTAVVIEPRTSKASADDNTSEAS